MKPKNILLIVTLIAAVVVIFYSMQESQDDTNYIAQINREREEKDRFMKTADDSPIAEKEKFKGLSYFTPNIKYKIVANLLPVEDKKVIVLATNDGGEERYLEYAYAEFVLDGQKNRLVLLEMIDMGPLRGKLFLAFGDETSAIETYGAGRYLDVEKVPGANTITLDFNKSYNPYCAYNETYRCPLPPRENLLKVAIRAGEKTYVH